MKTNIRALLLLIIFAVSCYKESSQPNSQDQYKTIQMNAPNFNDEHLSKTLLTPSSMGTAFAWRENDIVGVYSQSKGLTNFFIDEKSVSEDGLQANFNGAGFSLLPNSKYFAFYPYSANALDKNCIPINYFGQRVTDNGDFSSLGNFDYMYSKGLSDDNNSLSFSFEHIGVVVEIQVKVPETSSYKRLLMELENQDSENYIITGGTIDITEHNPTIKPSPYQADSVFFVNLDNIKIQKNEILKVYIMMPPQNLNGKNIVFRLIDSEQNCFQSIVSGKNMRAGYTYHYELNTLNGGFSGESYGFPNDEHYAELMDYYSHPQKESYFWLTSDGVDLYSTGLFGIRKLNYGSGSNLSLISESTVGLTKYQTGRAMVVNDDVLYLGVRQNTAGLPEKLSPEVSFFFESNLEGVNINATSPLSNNSTINDFIKKLRLKSVNKNDVDEILIYKGKPEGGVYKNVVQLKKSGVCIRNLYREVYSTEGEALQNLPSNYTNPNYGDYIEMDWNSITKRSITIKNVVLNNCGEFDSFESEGSATFDETGTGNPNRGGRCAKFKTTTLGDNKPIVIYSKAGVGGSVSLMIKCDNIPNKDVVVPLMSKGDIMVAALHIKPYGNGILFGFMIDDKIYTSNQVFSIKEWYNVQLKLSTVSADLLIRGMECGGWNRLIHIDDRSFDVSFDDLCLGIVSEANNVELLVDDYYYDTKDLDNVSFVNGALVVIDKKDLSVITRYSLDFKVCGVAISGNKLVVNFLNGFNVYNIDDPIAPKLIFSYRPNSFTEYQGVGTFENNGRFYALTCTYQKGFVIVDITDDNDIKIVSEFDFSSVYVDGESIQGRCYSFDVVVDYPYAYATVASRTEYCNTEKDHRGVLEIDLHDVHNPVLSFAEIPQNRLSRFTNCDQSPTRITKLGDCIFVNNREFGVEVFYVGTDGSLSYGTNVSMPYVSSSNAICTTSDGKLFVGDDDENGNNRNIYYYRWF